MSATIYDTHRCPNCEASIDGFATYEDGGSHGYEVRFFCTHCYCEWGLNPTLRLCDFIQQGCPPLWVPAYKLKGERTMKKYNPEKEARREVKLAAKRERARAWARADKAMTYIIVGSAMLIGVFGTIFIQLVFGLQ